MCLNCCCLDDRWKTRYHTNRLVPTAPSLSSNKAGIVASTLKLISAVTRHKMQSRESKRLARSENLSDKECWVNIKRRSDTEGARFHAYRLTHYCTSM